MITAPFESETSSHVEDDRTGLSVETLRRALADNLYYSQGELSFKASRNDFYLALAYTVRDRLMPGWLHTRYAYAKPETRIVAYLSAEFLVGPHLVNNLLNLEIYDRMRQAVEESGLDFQDLVEQEEEPGLGNGGLGRLAACYMDSLASLEIPAIGYGIRYEFGIFDQKIQDGWQVEITDKWLQFGNPWEIARPQAAVTVNFGGYTKSCVDNEGQFRVQWIPDRCVKGIPYDTPITGYGVKTVNTLRLWKCEAPESFNFQAFNHGNYYGAVDQKVNSENISKVLYPNDNPIQGKELRLEQQYFFVSCALQDMIRLHLESGRRLNSFHEKFAVQLNDTHPAIAVAELMRLLVDEHHLPWSRSWDITRRTFAFTNHTLLPEALEKWPVELFRRLLPRHLEIIYEINQRFLDQVRMRFNSDPQRIAQLSLIDESGDRNVRMAHLACVGSHSINGVAELHTRLLKTTILKDFFELSPEKFNNKTNGVTPRRWMLQSNPRLADLLTRKIGKNWIKNLEELSNLEGCVEDPDFCREWGEVKYSVKEDLSQYVRQQTGVIVDPNSLFDIQVKRIHEYKRQHLNALYIITLYMRLKANPDMDITPRTFIFGGKAAPGYYMAKLMIKLITSIGEVVNHDPDVRDRLKVVFLPDYNVKLAQQVYPAADLSEQVSMAGKEASGTGNMKFALNGAITIGTQDGANIEIREAVGDDNIYIFGLTTDEVSDLKAQGYNPWDYYQTNEYLKKTIDLIQSGYFSHGDVNLFRPLTDNLLNQDPFLLLADYQSYIDCQDRVSQAYRDRHRWTRMSILNTARMGRFSSDRAIRQYCQDIWDVEPVPIHIDSYDQSKASLQVE